MACPEYTWEYASEDGITPRPSITSRFNLIRINPGMGFRDNAQVYGFVENAKVVCRNLICAVTMVAYIVV